MTNPKGRVFERALVDWFRGRNFKVEWLRTRGSLDEGDLAVDERWVVEAKMRAKGSPLDLPGWTREAILETANYYKARPHMTDSPIALTIIKAPGKSIDDAYVVMRLSEFSANFMEKKDASVSTVSGYTAITNQQD